MAAAVVQQAWRALQAHRAQLRALARLRAASRHHGHFQRRSKCGGAPAAMVALLLYRCCQYYDPKDICPRQPCASSKRAISWPPRHPRI